MWHLGVQAALADTVIPLASVVAAEDPSEQPEIDIDPDPSKYSHLDVSRIPITLSVGLVRFWLLHSVLKSWE